MALNLKLTIIIIIIITMDSGWQNLLEWLRKMPCYFCSDVLHSDFKPCQINFAFYPARTD